jgi:hypothetical protein
MVPLRWQKLQEAARAAAAGDDSDGGCGEAAARRPHALCNPHARARMAAMADRDIDSLQFPK